MDMYEKQKEMCAAHRAQQQKEAEEREEAEAAAKMAAEIEEAKVAEAKVAADRAEAAEAEARAAADRAEAAEADDDHQTVTSWLSGKKDRYNQWHYRLTHTPGLKKQWADMQAKSVQEQIAFVEQICTMKSKAIKEALRCKTLVKEKTSGLSGEWISYQAACTKDSRELVDEYLRMGTMLSKPNPRLGPNSSVKAPFNLLVAFETEVYSDLHRKQAGDRPGHDTAHREW